MFFGFQRSMVTHRICICPFLFFNIVDLSTKLSASFPLTSLITWASLFISLERANFKILRLLFKRESMDSLRPVPPNICKSWHAIFCANRCCAAICWKICVLLYLLCKNSRTCSWKCSCRLIMFRDSDIRSWYPW